MTRRTATALLLALALSFVAGRASATPPGALTSETAEPSFVTLYQSPSVSGQPEAPHSGSDWPAAATPATGGSGDASPPAAPSPEPVSSDTSGPAPSPGAVAVPSAAAPGKAWRTAIASWYGAELYGNRTACGQTYGPSTWGVAHKTLRCGTLVQIRYGGRVATVPVVDRGPYIAGRTWDLTAAVAGYLHFSGVHAVDWRLP